MQLSPDLTCTLNDPLSRSKTAASLDVLKKTDKKAVKLNNSNNKSGKSSSGDNSSGKNSGDSKSPSPAPSFVGREVKSPFKTVVGDAKAELRLEA